ncbi:IS5 family transposase [Pseudovibrio sp. WM33]|uniref:IS5 family transposase n=1 Tax=Pseudovibrio sp. WM33 TaxID=1735585 RepID=UPI0007AE7746|nr:IS5 family transposase [Pseudovibrio sp. WM33]KZL24339.1 Transposase DDE domain protein [Pseudovibrio sp. WM33]
MPFKHNASRRDKFTKAEYRINNWPEYNESLRRRGDVTVWVADDVAKAWFAPHSKGRGRPLKFSGLAIETCLQVRLVFGLALRQCQGFVRSLFGLMQLDLPIPDFSTLSRRTGSLKLTKHRSTSKEEPVHLVVDSTGLKIFGAGEWQETKHGTKIKRRTWRKLHLGMDLNTGEILCAELTQDSVGDPTALPGLLDQIDDPVVKFLGDGAYDGEPTRQELAERFDGVEVIIPPPKTAVPSSLIASDPTPRDREIASIRTNGKMAWQKQTGYGQRARGETLMGRFKQVIGNKLKSHSFDSQRTEAKVGIAVLNKMTSLARPTFERVL